MITRWREFYDALLRSPSHVLEGATLEQWLASPRGDFEAMARRLCGGALSKEISSFIDLVYNPSGHARLKLASEEFQKTLPKASNCTLEDVINYVLNADESKALALSRALEHGMGWQHIAQRLGRTQNPQGFGVLNEKWTEAHNARRGEYASLYKSLLEAISKGAEL